MPAFGLALERFLPLAGDLVGRGVDGALHDFRGTGDRLVQSFLDRERADHDQPSWRRFEGTAELQAVTGPGACDGGDQRDLPEPSGQGTDALHHCPWVGARRNDREYQVCAAGRLGAGPEIRAREDPRPAGGLAGCR
jgi:hypothetical protein